MVCAVLHKAQTRALTLSLTPSQLPQIYTMLCTPKITLVPQRVTLLFAHPDLNLPERRLISAPWSPPPVPVRCTQTEGRCLAPAGPQPLPVFSFPFCAFLSLCSHISRRALPSPVTGAALQLPPAQLQQAASPSSQQVFLSWASTEGPMPKREAPGWISCAHWELVLTKGGKCTNEAFCLWRWAALLQGENYCANQS